MKHTPGPWEANKTKTCIYIESGALYPIALLFLRVNEKDLKKESKEETLANARLIAAAPELLEACKRAVFEYERLGMKNNIPYGYLQHAIAKAEGINATTF